MCWCPQAPLAAAKYSCKHFCHTGGFTNDRSGEYRQYVTSYLIYLACLALGTRYLVQGTKYNVQLHIRTRCALYYRKYCTYCIA